MRTFLCETLIITLLLFGVGCNNEPKIDYEAPTFNNITTGYVEPISDPIQASLIYGLERVKDYFVVLAFMDNSFVHIYDSATGEKICSAVGRGRARDELIFLDSYSLDRQRSLLTIYDASSRSILQVKILDNGDCMVDKVVDCDLPEFTTNIIDIGSDSLLLFSNSFNYDSIPRLFMMSDNKIIATYNDEPLHDAEISSTVYGQPRFSLSPDRSKFVIGSVYGLIMETYFVENAIEPINLSYFIEPELYPETIWGVSDIATTNNHIYTTYNGSSNLSGFDKIAVFDWSHNPIELINFQGGNLSYICIEDDDIYAIMDMGDGENRIVLLRKK